MTNIIPQPTNNPLNQENTLELQNNMTDINNFNINEKISYIVIIITLIIHIYLIYQTQDIIYRILLIICFISIAWLLNKKNKNRLENTVIDDDGVNVIEG